MNRQIEFRAWVNDEMIYLPLAGLQYFDFEGSYALSFVVDGYKEFWAHENYDTPSIKERISNAIIMQWTGLLDENGTKIYEGDVVYLAGYGNHTVVFPFMQLYDSAYEGDIGNILGNIYQHPELINKAI